MNNLDLMKIIFAKRASDRLPCTQAPLCFFAGDLRGKGAMGRAKQAKRRFASPVKSSHDALRFASQSFREEQSPGYKAA